MQDNMKLLHQLALALVFIVLTALSTEAGPQGRIVNGYRAASGKFPHHVGVLRNIDEPWCGGSLLSENWVLTAAHCVYGMPQVYLKFGTTNLSQPLVTRTVSAGNIIVHPRFDAASQENDIALINMPAVELSAFIWPIGLPGIGVKSSFEGIVGTVSGWGRDHTGQIDPERLNYAFLRIISNAKCAEYYGTAAITINKLCVSTLERMSICDGDSGSALFEDRSGVQLGIASFVTNFGCNLGAPAGFVRITSYLEWIKQVSGISY